MDNWKRTACDNGVHLENLKKPLKAVEKQGYIELVGDQFVRPVQGKHIDIKDSQGKDLIFTRDIYFRI